MTEEQNIDEENADEELTLEELVARDFPALSRYVLEVKAIIIEKVFDRLDAGQSDQWVVDELPPKVQDEFFQILELDDDDRLAIIQALFDSLSPQVKERLSGN